jgi:hypothetical protein
MKNAIAWFEIPTTQLAAAQAFYETVLGHPMRRKWPAAAPWSTWMHRLRWTQRSRVPWQQVAAWPYRARRCRRAWASLPTSSIWMATGWVCMPMFE